MRHRRASAVPKSALIAVTVLVLLTVVEFVPLLMGSLALPLDPQHLTTPWQHEPIYWLLVLVFAAPLAVATVVVLVLRVHRGVVAVLAAGFGYTVAVQLEVFRGVPPPLVASRLTDSLGRVPVFAVDVLRVAAYPSLVLLAATSLLLVAFLAWPTVRWRRWWGWAYLGLAIVVILGAGWFNATRYA